MRPKAAAIRPLIQAAFQRAYAAGTKIAELVAVPGDPFADISLMTKVSLVAKAGKVYKQ